MRSVGLRVLKNRLSEYVRLVASGETVLITDRGRVVAELVPPRRGRQVASDPALAEAIRQGWLTPPLFPAGAPLPPRRPVMTLQDLMQELGDDREG
jgi:prevent-host-death family protein